MDERAENDYAQYTDLFVSEAQDHLQEMNRALLRMEESQARGTSEAEAEQVAVLFRAAHTLKGMAAALGFQQIAVLAHRMEDAFDLLRQKQRCLTPDLANALFACLDRVGGLVESVSAAGSDAGDAGREMAVLEDVLRASPQAPAPPGAPEPAAAPTARPCAFEARLQIAPDCQLKGPRAFVVLRRLSALAPILECRPPETELLAGRYAEGFSLFFGAEADPQALEQAAGHLTEVTAVRVTENLPERRAGPLPAAHERELAPEAGAPARPIPAAPAEQPPAPVASPLKSAGPAAPEPEAAAMVRLKVDLLDQLLEAVADMVVNHSLLVQVARKHSLPDLKDGLDSHAAAIKRLEQVVLSMRMTPVAQVFNRFPRLVRDLARDLGKDVHLDVEGAEIELDRMILDRLSDPLVHLLRNAVDHGIEPPDERERAGKPLPARIRLAARREQNKVLIEVSDDGRGLSTGDILRVALERGLLTPRQATDLDQAAILELICLPGFSTKTQVSGISGRGVGMDVVKRTLSEMGGGLEIESSPGQGSLFRLICPLTMAILPAILVRCGAERYAIPLTHVVHTLDVPSGDLRWLFNQPVLPWEDGLLPLFSLGEFLGARGAAPLPRLEGTVSPDGARLYEIDTQDPDSLPPDAAGRPAGQAPGVMIQAVMVARGSQAYGLVVDEILGKEDIVLKPLVKYLGSITGLSGVTLFGEGEMALVLDVAGLVQALASGGKGGGDA